MTTPTPIKWLIAIPLLLMTCLAQAASLSVSSLNLLIGNSATIKVQEIKGSAVLSNANPSVAVAKLTTSRSSGSIQLTALRIGSTTLTLSDKKGSKSVRISVLPPMSVSPASLTLPVKQIASIQISNASGEVRVSSSHSEVASASLSDGNIKLEAKTVGTTLLTIRDKFTTLTATVTVTAGSTQPPPSGNTDGRLLASNCFQCHGTNGSGGFEKLMGKDDIYQELQEYLNGGEDADGIMAAHLKGYTPAQLQAISDYLANP